MWSPREQPRRSTRLWKSFGKRSRTAAAASGTDMSSSRAHVACQGKRGKKNGNLPGKTLGKRIFLLPDLTPAGTSRGFLFFIFFPQNSRGFGVFPCWIWGFPSENSHGFGVFPPKISMDLGFCLPELFPGFLGIFSLIPLQLLLDSLEIIPWPAREKKTGISQENLGKNSREKGFPPPRSWLLELTLPATSRDLGFPSPEFPWIWGFSS